jgi:hypothetical protein
VRSEKKAVSLVEYSVKMRIQESVYSNLSSIPLIKKDGEVTNKGYSFST